MQEWINCEVVGQVGFITLSRPKALNALSLSMVRGLYQALSQWQDDASIRAVAIRGSDKAGPFGGFCAGGDIRFFHTAALAGNAELEDFFTEEYALNHLIHNFSKPYIAFMDGIVMGGGMGISQGASVRIVTGRTKMAMPEAHIGLFPDVGGGYFLSRCPGHTGEWLALTGQVIDGATAMQCGLADRYLDATSLQACWDSLGRLNLHGAGAASDAIDQILASHGTQPPLAALDLEKINQHFAHESVLNIVTSLRTDNSEWAQHALASLLKSSPLMLHVTLAQVRRARTMSLAEDLRMERDLVRHCFNPLHLGRPANSSETVEGIRALAVDKDHTPAWQPARLEQVTPEMVLPFFQSPWPDYAHPLAHLR